MRLAACLEYQYNQLSKLIWIFVKLIWPANQMIRLRFRYKYAKVYIPHFQSCFYKESIFAVPILNFSYTDYSISVIEMPYLILEMQKGINCLFRNIFDDACCSSTPKRKTKEQEDQSGCAERCFTNLNVSNEKFNVRINDIFLNEARRSDFTFTSQLLQDTSAIEVLDEYLEEGNSSMHTNLTRLINECTSVPISADDPNHSERRQDGIEENMRTDCTVGGKPLPDDISNNVSQEEEVSENQLSFKKQRYKWERKQRKKEKKKFFCCERC